MVGGGSVGKQICRSGSRLYQTMYGGDGLDDVEVVDYEPDDEDEVIAS